MQQFNLSGRVVYPKRMLWMVWVALSLVSPAFASPFPSDTTLTEWMVSLLPEAQTVSARKLERAPEIASLEAKALGKLVASKTRTHMRQGGTRNPFTLLFKSMLNQLTARRAMMVYMPDEHCIYVNREVLDLFEEHLSKKAETLVSQVRDSQYKAYFMPMIFHELIHAIQSENLDWFNTIQQVQDPLQTFLASLRVEGMAVLFETQYTQRHPDTFLVSPYTDFRPGEIARLRVHNFPALPYILGYPVAQRIFEKRGIEGLWAWLKSPSASFHRVLYPDMDLTKGLKTLEQIETLMQEQGLGMENYASAYLRGTDTVVMRDSLTLFLNPLPPLPSEQWTWGQRHGVRGVQPKISVFEFESESHAKKYVQSLRAVRLGHYEVEGSQDCTTALYQQNLYQKIRARNWNLFHHGRHVIEILYFPQPKARLLSEKILGALGSS